MRTDLTTSLAAVPVGLPEDPTEAIRRHRLAELNPGSGKAELERRHGQTWNPGELTAGFEVVGFMAPLVVVKRKADGKLGSMEFQHEPRFYFNLQEDTRGKDGHREGK